MGNVWCMNYWTQTSNEIYDKNHYEYSVEENYSKNLDVKWIVNSTLGKAKVVHPQIVEEKKKPKKSMSKSNQLNKWNCNLLFHGD